MAIRINTRPTAEAKVSIDLLENLAPKEAPHKRPTIIRNQYVPTKLPAVVGSMPNSSLVANKFIKFGIPTSTPT